MPPATLLLREPTALRSLTALVEHSQRLSPPFPTYTLQVTATHLHLTPIHKPTLIAAKPKNLNPCKPNSLSVTPSSPTSADEGFESDVDTLSIVSAEEACIKPPVNETDSANGSASSDSDNETTASVSTTTSTSTLTAASVAKSNKDESYSLVDCVCYTDVKFPDVLVFVAKGEVLVFRFEHNQELQTFYLHFNALKAVCNQKAYSGLLGTKFNLLQRTDNNGVTHIQITREHEVDSRISSKDISSASRIISLKAPDANRTSNQYGSYTLKRDVNSRQRNESLLLSEPRFQTLENPKQHQKLLYRSTSTENLLDHNQPPLVQSNHQSRSSLKKIWSSAEDLLVSAPKVPERRKKPKKGRAPPPPVLKNDQSTQQRDVCVKLPIFNHNLTIIANKPSFSNILNGGNKKLTTYQQFKYSEPKKSEATANTLTRNINKNYYNYNNGNSSNINTYRRYFPESSLTSWTNSVPRLLKKPRSRSETRNFTPMAYRYIDTTADSNDAYCKSSTISNRLFGMSSKLKDFPDSGNGGRCNDRSKWGSLGDLSHKIQKECGLKSVIKKEDHSKRKSGDKKVTFSAYTTVQVV